jgi:hypothetical protein
LRFLKFIWLLFMLKLPPPYILYSPIFVFFNFYYVPLCFELRKNISFSSLFYTKKLAHFHSISRTLLQKIPLDNYTATGHLRAEIPLDSSICPSTNQLKSAGVNFDSGTVLLPTFFCQEIFLNNKITHCNCYQKKSSFLLLAASKYFLLV